jgi:AcrR family transcriptional regulator
VVTDFRCRQILEAARQTFVREGVADTSVDQIARSAGIAKGTIYLYYKSKDEILRQLLTADLSELEAETLPAIAEPGTLEERLDRFFRASLGFFERKRDFIEQCHLDMSADVRKKAKLKLGLVYTAQTETWTKALLDSRRPGSTIAGLPATHASGLARTIVALAHGLALQRLRGWAPGTVEESAAMAAVLVANGVGKS